MVSGWKKDMSKQKKKFFFVWLRLLIRYTRNDCHGENCGKTNIDDKHRWVSEGEPRERWMFCWCLDLWKSTNNGYIPNCFSFIKLRPIVSLLISVHNSRWCHTYFEKKTSSKPSTWNGWHNSWLHGFHQDHWTQIHQWPGRRWREGKEIGKSN